ncbi:MAG: TonB-dependent receptor [Sphingomicrobium sp.]
MKKIVLLCTTAMLPSVAFAQSTGTVETEKDTIVITGTRAQKGTSGVVIQDSTKAKGLITQEYIARQNPGQSLLNTINYIPGVNFTQNDAYGSSGGNLRIRGFDGNRVSVTFDGVPLNDSGNYAIFSNQLLDPELVEQVNVNLGATDVDSPTASAAGGTVNFRSLIPTNDPGFLLDGSIGSFNFARAFGMVQTGRLTSFGTKAWFAASRNTYDHWRGEGRISKWQVNGKIYQPLGSNGDFISIAGHYNQNRNNNYNNPTLTDLRNVTAIGPATVGASPPAAYPVVVGNFTDAQWAAVNSIVFPKFCRNASGAVVTRVAGASDPSTCTAPEEPAGLQSQALTNLLGVQINPSNTGNIRGQSRFTLGDGLVLTIDPTFQYVLANGGSQGLRLSEKDNILKQGIAAGVNGVDLNGDGDTLDTILVGRPSITNTHRITVISSLVWRIDPNNTIRVAYTYDRAHHRQTGEYGFTDNNFNLENPFFGRNGRPVLTAAGMPAQNRDRTSIALLNQLSGQYIGKFIDQKLRLELGIRSPWFVRDLDQHCYTPLTSNVPLCVSNPTGLTPAFVIRPVNYDTTIANAQDLWAPFKAHYKYHKILPNIGATFAIDNALSIFASYAKGLSAPRTDNLYRAPVVTVQPETTDSFDLGGRYITGRFQAQATVWKINYQNRIVTTFDPDLQISVDRNVGKVNAWGFDGGLGFKPIRQLNLIGLLSYNHSTLQENLLVTNVTYNSAAPPPATTLTPFLYYCSPIPTTGTAKVNICGRTAGKFVVETPEWQYGGRAEIDVKPFRMGIQAKHVGSRWATDVNDVKVTGYTTVDLDARVGLEKLLGKKSYLQLNVVNLFNEHYFGNLSTQINAFGAGGTAPRFTPVSTRAISGTLAIGL